MVFDFDTRPAKYLSAFHGVFPTTSPFFFFFLCFSCWTCSDAFRNRIKCCGAKQIFKRVERQPLALPFPSSLPFASRVTSFPYNDRRGRSLFHHCRPLFLSVPLLLFVPLAPPWLIFDSIRYTFDALGRLRRYVSFYHLQRMTKGTK